MLARLQRFTTLAGVALALLWLGLWFRAGHWAVAIAGASLITLGHAFVLGLEFLAVARVNQSEAVGAPGSRALWSAWRQEVRIAPRVFCWWQPFRSWAQGDEMPSPAPTGLHPPVAGLVLVHGFICNRGFWSPWMARLRGLGVPYMAVTLEPVFGSIDQYVEAIDAAVRRMRASVEAPVVLVAHSMGGLAVRAWHSRQDGDDGIAQVITIGSPHQGTWMGRFAVSRNAQQMRRGSDWLRTLEQREAARSAAPYQLYTCFYSHCDNVVFPASTATLPGADNRHLPGRAHIQMAYDDAVFDAALQAFQQLTRLPRGA